MRGMLRNPWWITTLRSIATVIFGLSVLLLPNITIELLIVLFGVYVIIEGILHIFDTVFNRSDKSRGWLTIVQALLNIVFGVITVSLPGITAITMLYIVAIYTIAKGILDIVSAIFFKDDTEMGWMVWGSGLLSIVFGSALILQPETSVLAILAILGLYSIIYGVFAFAYSFQIRWTQQPIKDLVNNTTAFSS